MWIINPISLLNWEITVQIGAKAVQFGFGLSGTFRNFFEIVKKIISFCALNLKIIFTFQLLLDHLKRLGVVISGIFSDRSCQFKGGV